MEMLHSTHIKKILIDSAAIVMVAIKLYHEGNCFLSLAYLWMLNILLNICLCEFAVRTNLIIMGNKDNSKAANWKTLALNSQDCNILFHVSFSKEDYHNHNICSMFLLLHIIIQTTLTFEIPFKLCSECTFYHFICTTS